MKETIIFGKTFANCFLTMHSLKRNDLAAHLEMDKCFTISQFFQAIFALSFENYIEGICKSTDLKDISHICHTFLDILCAPNAFNIEPTMRSKVVTFLVSASAITQLRKKKIANLFCAKLYFLFAQVCSLKAKHIFNGNLQRNIV